MMQLWAKKQLKQNGKNKRVLKMNNKYVLPRLHYGEITTTNYMINLK